MHSGFPNTDTHRLKSRRLLKRSSASFLALIPIQISKPAMEVLIFVPNHLQIALENREIRNIKSDQGRVQPDVRFRDVLPEQIRLVSWPSEVFLQPVERFENRIDVGVVCFLCRRETRFVHTVVDCVIDPFVHVVNLRSKVTGQKAPFSLGFFAPFTRKKIVESGIEHTNDFATFIVDNGF